MGGWLPYGGVGRGQVRSVVHCVEEGLRFAGGGGAELDGEAFVGHGAQGAEVPAGVEGIIDHLFGEPVAHCGGQGGSAQVGPGVGWYFVDRG